MSDPRLSVQHADALWDAVAIPGPKEPTFTEQHERVCRAVAQIIDEVTPAPVEPPADQAALRDRIAAAIWARYPDAEPSRTGLVMANPHALADTVLAVLPPPVSRADILRDFLWRLEQSAGDAAAEKFLDDNPELRRMADEAQQTEPACTCGGPATSTTLASGVTYEEHARTCAVMAGEAQPGTEVQAAATIARVERLALAFEVSGNEFIAERIRAAVTGVEAQPGTEAWDVPDARPGTTDHTITQRATGAQQDGAQR